MNGSARLNGLRAFKYAYETGCPEDPVATASYQRFQTTPPEHDRLTRSWALTVHWENARLAEPAPRVIAHGRKGNALGLVALTAINSIAVKPQLNTQSLRVSVGVALANELPHGALTPRYQTDLAWRTSTHGCDWAKRIGQTELRVW